MKLSWNKVVLSKYFIKKVPSKLDGRQKQQQTTNGISYEAARLKTNLAKSTGSSVGRGLGCIQLVDAVEGLGQAAVHVEPPVTDEELLVEDGT